VSKIMVASDYKVKPLPREKEDKMCPHCDAPGSASNRYLYRCSNVKCGRYW